MATQWMIGLAFVLMAGALAGAFLLLAVDARRENWDGIYRRAGVIRRRWFFGLLTLAVIAFGVSMTWLPYGFMRDAQLPGPATAVAVIAQQYDFKLDTDCLPDAVPIDFSVTSGDVNHTFAIYDPEGFIVGQVQAMPGFTNVLRIALTEPGNYTIRCSELCGPGHPFMKHEITVGGCGSGAAAGCGGGGCA